MAMMEPTLKSLVVSTIARIGVEKAQPDQHTSDSRYVADYQEDAGDAGAPSLDECEIHIHEVQDGVHSHSERKVNKEE